MIIKTTKKMTKIKSITKEIIKEKVKIISIKSSDGDAEDNLMTNDQ
jgi:hypothetical protein